MARVTKETAKPAAEAKPPFALEGIDHILLLVSGMKPAVRFYTEVLGCRVEGELPQYGMLQLRAGAALMDLVDIAAPEAGWAKPPVAGGRNVDHLCLGSEFTMKRNCAGTLPAIGLRSSKKACMAEAAARACRSTSATRPEMSSS
jgi:hypothetical protein